MTIPGTTPTFKGPRKRKPKSARASLTRTWTIRFGIALGAGLLIGGIAGIVGVNVLEPARATTADGLQVTLDSITRGDTPIPPAPSRPSANDAPAADTGAGDPSGVAIPDLVGIDEGAARSALERAGLVAGGSEFRASRSPAGTVLATVPVFGASVPRGTAITLVLSDGKPPVDSLRPSS